MGWPPSYDGLVVVVPMMVTNKCNHTGDVGTVEVLFQVVDIVE